MLHCYGENSFTFLLFQELNQSPELVKRFISNLKSFKNGNKFILEKTDKTTEEEPQIWLFPNFGTRYGFGEPDAIVLYAGHTFWIEVETNFNLRNRSDEAKTAIKQLLRFFYLNQAISFGKTRNKESDNHLSWVGLSIDGNDNIKRAHFKAANQSVLGKYSKEFQEAIHAHRDHYVLLSDKKMIEITKEENDKTALQSLFETTSNNWQALFEGSTELSETFDTPNAPTIDRFWYQYYESDLKNKIVTFGNEEVQYLRKKSS